MKRAFPLYNLSNWEQCDYNGLENELCIWKCCEILLVWHRWRRWFFSTPRLDVSGLTEEEEEREEQEMEELSDLSELADGSVVSSVTDKYGFINGLDTAPQAQVTWINWFVVVLFNP